MERLKMLMISVSRTAWPTTCRGDEVADLPNPFEGTFVSIAGNRLFVDSEHNQFKEQL